MNILIVEDCSELAKLWQRALERVGAVVARSQSVTEAIYQIQSQCFDVIVTNLICDGVPTMPVADYAAYRSPKSQVIFVTNTSFFSDGSIFRLCANAAGFLQRDTPPENLAALAQHYAASVPNVSRLCGAQ